LPGNEQGEIARWSAVEEVNLCLSPPFPAFHSLWILGQECLGMNGQDVRVTGKIARVRAVLI
jgi:hypothetical protein